MKVKISLNLFSSLLTFSVLIQCSQGQKKKKSDKELLPEGIKCYTCGLETIDPEEDKPGSYGVKVYSTPQLTDYKMYNHSCDQMDRKEGQDVPVSLNFDDMVVEGVGEKANLELVTATGGQYDLKRGFEIYQEDYKKLRESVPDLPKWEESQVIQSKVKENYNMDMWIKQCDRGIYSCYVAQGFYDEQDPVFRGCAGNFFPHDEKCTTQQQAVTIVEGKKSVDVEVELCYCNEDLCNIELNGANALHNWGIMGILVIIFVIFNSELERIFELFELFPSFHELFELLE